MLEMADKDIGGARVRRTFTFNGKQMKMNDQMTAEEVLSIRVPNRRALTDSSFIELFPKAPAVTGERFMVGISGDKYNIIEGRVVNDTPLSRKEAEKLLHA